MNDENKYIYINKYIDKKPMFTNYEIDTVIIFVVGFGAFVIIGGYAGFGLFILGILATIINEKLKDTKYKNYIGHILYILGFKEPKTNRLPKSYKKRFLK